MKRIALLVILFIAAALLAVLFYSWNAAPAPKEVTVPLAVQSSRS